MATVKLVLDTPENVPTSPLLQEQLGFSHSSPGPSSGLAPAVPPRSCGNSILRFSSLSSWLLKMHVRTLSDEDLGARDPQLNWHVRENRHAKTTMGLAGEGGGSLHQLYH